MAPVTRNSGKTPAVIKPKQKPLKRLKNTQKEAKKEMIPEVVKDKIPKKKAGKTEEKSKLTDKSADSIYEFTVNNIKGEPVSLKAYKGQVCIIVNVASRCGHTKSNYEQLVKLHQEYGKSKGLKILGFPCNQFGSQEPGDSDKICEFVKKKNVKFDMFEKIFVNGAKAHPLFTYLKGKIVDPKTKANNIKWNFAKFIIDKNGQPVERFSSATKPITLVETLEKYW